MVKIGISCLNSLLVKIESENQTPVHKSCSRAISLISGQMNAPHESWTGKYDFHEF